MIDLHTHSLFSDGELVPSEIVRRSRCIGYTAIAITDHADSSNLDFIIPRVAGVAKELNQRQPVKVVPGIELTHMPPDLVAPLVKRSRELGAALIVVHGETVAEPVTPGTNRAAIEAKADILAHPGLITHEDAALAAKSGVYLEISSRAGHSLCNGHVAKTALETGAALLLNTDAHSPGDLITDDFAAKVVEGSGLPADSLQNLLANSRQLLERAGYVLDSGR